MLFNKTFCDASVDWQFGFQEPATPTAEGILDFHDYLVFFCILICILVFFCILILVFLPLINFSKIRSSKFRHIFSFFYWVLFRRIIILFGKKKINLDVFINQNYIKKAFLHNKTRIRSVSRCLLTNRSRGVSKKFNLSRFILRDLMQFGLIPGYSKSVW